MAKRDPYKPGLGSMKAPGLEKKADFAAFRTLQSDPRSLGLTDAEREREAATARRLGGVEAEAQSRAQTLGLSKQLEQQKAQEIRARFGKVADRGRQQAKNVAKAVGNVAKIGAGVVTGQPTLALSGVQGLTGGAQPEVTVDKEGYSQSAVGQMQQKMKEKREKKKATDVIGGLS